MNNSNRNYKVVVTPMKEHIANKVWANQYFSDYAKAYNHFVTVCDSLDLIIPYHTKQNCEQIEAGGRGYDYTVELTAEN